MAFRFTNPASDFSTEQFLLEPGKADLKIMSAKLRTFRDENSGEITGGIVNIAVRVASGEHKDKMVNSIQCWFQDDGSNPEMMRVVLASVGIKPGTKEADAKFKEEFPDIDLGFSEDEGHKPNDGWSKIVGNVVTVTVNKPWSTKLERYENTYKNVRPMEVSE